MSCRNACGSLLLLSVVLGACDRDRPRRPPRPAGPAASVAANPQWADGGPLPRPSAVPSALLELRARRLELTPRSVPAERIAFGHGRLGQLTHDALVVRDSHGFQVVVELPVEAPRRLVGLGDGSLLAAGRERVLRLPKGATRPEEHGRVTLFADSTVLPDARDPQRLWVAHPGDRTLYLHQLKAGGAAGMLPFDQLLPVEGCDGRGLTTLGDGSFACTTSAGLRHFWPEGKRVDLSLPAARGAVWRLLPTSRIDQVWMAREQGKLDLYQLGTTAGLLRTLALRDQPIDIAARGKSVAVVSVTHPPGEARRWSVVVLDEQGKELMQAAVPGTENVATDDWVAELLLNRGVVLSRDETEVAVGGPSSLTVWDIASGRQLFSTARPTGK
jgi:hypothetical protein